MVIALSLCGIACGGGGQAPVGAVGPASNDGGSARDGASSPGPGGAVCVAQAPPVDLCQALPRGTITACSLDGGGNPSQTGYMEIAGADGSRWYVCATSWSDGGSGGYWFGFPDQFMSDPQSCCGGSASPTAAPTAPPTAAGALGALHAAQDIKPQEMSKPGAGPIRQNPFAVVVRDQTGGAAVAAAVAGWQAWAGDGKKHPAPDGTGGFYFPAALLINYVILETPDAAPVVVIGPEVSSTADGKSPLGHPTLGGCSSGGGAPVVLMAGELGGANLTNHSGRFGHDPSLTPDTLANAAALFNCLGITVTGTTYYPPKP
jgi:hypothetical protein